MRTWARAWAAAALFCTARAASGCAEAEALLLTASPLPGEHSASAVVAAAPGDYSAAAGDTLEWHFVGVDTGVDVVPEVSGELPGGVYWEGAGGAAPLQPGAAGRAAVRLPEGLQLSNISVAASPFHGSLGRLLVLRVALRRQADPPSFTGDALTLRPPAGDACARVTGACYAPARLRAASGDSGCVSPDAPPAEPLRTLRLRFTALATREPGAEGPQLTEVELRDGDGAPVPVAAASCPGGRSPPGEGPEMAADGSRETKWLDLERAPLLLELAAAANLSAVRLSAVPSEPGRDPVRFLLEGSTQQDGAEWHTLLNRSGRDAEFARSGNGSAQVASTEWLALDPLPPPAPVLLLGGPVRCTTSVRAEFAEPLADAHAVPAGAPPREARLHAALAEAARRQRALHAELRRSAEQLRLMRGEAAFLRSLASAGGNPASCPNAPAPAKPAEAPAPPPAPAGAGCAVRSARLRVQRGGAPDVVLSDQRAALELRLAPEGGNGTLELTWALPGAAGGCCSPLLRELFADSVAQLSLEAAGPLPGPPTEHLIWQGRVAVSCPPDGAA